ncbi:MAG TPA: hypothetical protein VGH74_11605 [Planctomycetaceae bacterium]|jgi:hypothetical protein
MLFTPHILRSLPRTKACGVSRKAILAGILALAAFWPGAGWAQSTNKGRYFALDQSAAPGVAGKFAGVQRGFIPVMQFVKVELPNSTGEGSGGQVDFYTNAQGESAAAASPAIAALRVGSVYRLKISDMPDFPGAELYPTIELIDRLHPPRGREVEFAIPITLTAEEIAMALEGRLVTKVIYLEQPDRAAPVRNTNAARNRLADPRENLLAVADEAGRPMVIVRLGGRLPDAAASESGFFGFGEPVQVLERPASAKEEAAKDETAIEDTTREAATE